MFLKNFFKKTIFYECIIWDGKMLSYLTLSDEEIKNMLDKNDKLTITKKEDL